MDISSTIDYYCSEIYFAQKDWPSNNYKTWRGGGSTRWRYLFYDLDSGWGYQGAADTTLMYASSPVSTTIFNPPYATFLFRKLLKSPQFVAEFLHRYACLLKNEFEESTIEAALDHFVNMYTPGMPHNIDRWHNVNSMNSWMSRVNEKLYDFNAERQTYAIQHVSEHFNINFDPASYDCLGSEDTFDDGVVTSLPDGVSPGILKIYPNPSSDAIWVDAEIPPNHELRIFDMTGRLVYHEPYEFHKKVGVSDLSAGIYTVLISDGTNQLMSHFVKQ